MKAKITVELEDGTTLSGVLDSSELDNPPSRPATHTPAAAHTNEDALAAAIQTLVAKGVFEDTPVMTTPELTRALVLKSGHKISKGNEARQLSRFVTQANPVLDRDDLPATNARPKGVQIWYLHGTPKATIDAYKQKH